MSVSLISVYSENRLDNYVKYYPVLPLFPHLRLLCRFLGRFSPHMLSMFFFPLNTLR